MKKDRINNVAIENGVTPAVKTADDNGAGIDLQQYLDGCKFVVSVGAEGDSLTAINYIECEVEESSDNATFTDAADADVIGSVTGTNTGTFAKLDASADNLAAFQGQYTGIKRYCRVVLNFTGASHTNGTNVSVVAEKLGYKYLPVS